jgi:putative DNA primase/helicase
MSAVEFNTIERARHRWREILPQLGIETRFLTNKHGPCPLCGGRDRFRFDDKDGSGSYYCNRCGPGAGVILVCKKNGWDFKTACDAIDKIIGTAANPNPRRPRQNPQHATHSNAPRRSSECSMRRGSRLSAKPICVAAASPSLPPCCAVTRAVPISSRRTITGIASSVITRP